MAAIEISLLVVGVAYAIAGALIIFRQREQIKAYEIIFSGYVRDGRLAKMRAQLAEAEAQNEALAARIRDTPRVTVTESEVNATLELLREIDNTTAEQGSIYFVGNREHRIVKIGYSADPTGRLATLQTACPYTLELFGSIEGSTALEKALHDRFAYLHLRGEWFTLADDLERLAAMSQAIVRK